MGGGLPPRGGIPRPSPRVVKAAEERAPVVGAEAPATGRSVEETARAAEAPVRAAEASRSVVATVTGAIAASARPSRKRKRGFSTLR
jgi:hypothetical protein